MQKTWYKSQALVPLSLPQSSTMDAIATDRRVSAQCTHIRVVRYSISYFILAERDVHKTHFTLLEMCYYL